MLSMEALCNQKGVKYQHPLPHVFWGGRGAAIDFARRTRKMAEQLRCECPFVRLSVQIMLPGENTIFGFTFMSKASVCHGDPTTTGGKVIATASTMFDGDRRIALDGEMATCGNCPGEHPIQGTGTDMDEDGRASVQDNDPVQCPCGKNHVKAGSDAGCSTG